MPEKNIIRSLIKSTFWFFFGAVVGFFFFISFLFIIYKATHFNRVYDGVRISGVDFGGKTAEQVRSFFAVKNREIGKTTFTFTCPVYTATISARQIGFRYDEDLLSQQAISVGRSSGLLSNISLIVQAYFNTINLSPAGTYQQAQLNAAIAAIYKKLRIDPVNGLFTLDNGKVAEFVQPKNGQTVLVDKLAADVLLDMHAVINSGRAQAFIIPIPIKEVKPPVTSDNANKLGIHELIGEGSSLFYGSSDSRIYNITLAASRLNGVLVAPGTVFSFDQTIGDISVLTGYEQAYVIENGQTVLGDGGGVCQVSTTLFRAALNAGLPIAERHQHAYRVGYYEEDSPVGIDAAVYYPTVDFKFSNDTGNYILIQSSVDTDNDKLVFDLFGTGDGRTAFISTPVILSQTPAPAPKYIDDPAIPKGTVRQTDFAAGGADVYFTRTVTRKGQVILSDKFTSDYQPWQAVYVRGTKE